MPADAAVNSRAKVMVERKRGTGSVLRNLDYLNCLAAQRMHGDNKITGIKKESQTTFIHWTGLMPLNHQLTSMSPSSNRTPPLFIM